MPVDSKAGAIMLTIIVVVLYFLPTIHAKGRKHPNLDGIFVLNLFLGWTLIGWVVAIIWAVSAIKREPEVPADSYSKLEKLASLKERGYISEEEFQREKNKLLKS